MPDISNASRRGPRAPKSDYALDLKALARQGAAARLAQIAAEARALLEQFPDLESTDLPFSNARSGRRSASQPAQAESGTRRGRKPMSAAARKATSARMKKYWADRRKKAASSR